MSDRPGSLSEPRQVRATFADADRMQDAVSRLSVSGFDRADLGLAPVREASGSDLAAEAKPPSTEEDARQARILGASTAGAAAAIAAAVVAGGAAGGAAFAVHGAINQAEQHDRDAKAAAGTLVLTVRARTETKQSQAEAILRAAGARPA